MTKNFKPLISQIVEVYIDDIVVKSKTKSEHALHLVETFRLMRSYNMNLYLSKYAFCISVGKFMGFMVTQRGIEVNPDQIRVVMEMSALSNRELQRLTGRLAALGRFIARFIDKLWPFFLALKGENTTGWTNDCKQALEKIKRYFTQPPILSCLEPGEQLYMYYVSKAMVGIETRYFKMEQTTLALKSAAQKLRPYFQAHQVTMLTNQPLRSILHRLDLSKRMLKWAIELSEYEIKYQPRLALKRHVMADFIAEVP